jgi:hypothetical protein
MARRTIKYLTGKSSNLNSRSRFNILVNLIVAVSFFITAGSGLYFLFLPEAHGRSLPGTAFLFSQSTWKLMHTWGGVILSLAAVAHFLIHWKWVKKVTRNIFTQLYQSRPFPKETPMTIRQ